MKDNINVRRVWTDVDFEQMAWHDCKIYAITFNEENFELIFDIDYIVKWESPEAGDYYKFWVSPTTLVFRNVYDVDLTSRSINLEIDEIARKKLMNVGNHEGEAIYDWIIALMDGEITFKSVGYTQYLRNKPLLSDKQQIGLYERGGISFEKNGA